LEAIVRRSAGLLKVKIDNDAASLLAKSSRGTPRVVNQLLKRMRDFAQYAGEPSITLAVVHNGLSRLEIDELGLEKQDREILKIIIERYNGGPVGADTLAISIGESVETLEDYYEPYLIQAGLIQRTPRGRVVTNFAYGHLGLAPNNNILMKTSDFSFHLPENLIAQFPPEKRGQSRLMTLNRVTGKRTHRMVEELPEILRGNEFLGKDGSLPLLVFNNTKVRKARLIGVSEETGARVESFG